MRYLLYYVLPGLEVALFPRRLLYHQTDYMATGRLYQESAVWQQVGNNKEQKIRNYAHQGRLPIKGF